ncbi:Nuclear cap-binding protein [Balamuthia mandrillaris]
MSIITAENHRRVLYVGGLAEEVTEEILRAAFLPFGEVITVMIPMDYKSERNRGFGFVEFELQEDAVAAQDNMNNAELYGRVLVVTIAKARAMERNRAVWDTNADEFFAVEDGTAAAPPGDDEKMDSEAPAAD